MNKLTLDDVVMVPVVGGESKVNITGYHIFSLSPNGTKKSLLYTADLEGADAFLSGMLRARLEDSETASLLKDR